MAKIAAFALQVHNVTVKCQCACSANFCVNYANCDLCNIISVSPAAMKPHNNNCDDVGR